MAYIEREAFRKHLMGDATKFYPASFAQGIAAASHEAMVFPAADVVPVVRCKDCKHGKHHIDGYVRCSHPAGRVLLMRSSDFCSYGERKDGE